jgi:drug/metabolite transporter (DMT)-like permease
MRWFLLGLVMATTVASDLLQSHEMKLAGEQRGDAKGLWRILKLVTHRKWLVLAIALMAVSFFAFLALIQTQPLSFAVPASAGSFILETLLAKILLKENVGALRAAGALLVFVGILMVTNVGFAGM